MVWVVSPFKSTHGRVPFTPLARPPHTTLTLTPNQIVCFNNIHYLSQRMVGMDLTDREYGIMMNELWNERHYLTYFRIKRNNPHREVIDVDDVSQDELIELSERFV